MSADALFADALRLGMPSLSPRQLVVTLFLRSHLLYDAHAEAGCEAVPMTNPWLDIPLHEYEAHMALPSVGQAQMLSEIFARAIERHRPRSIAVLGCAGGNGLERIPTGSGLRIVCLDINPDYISHARARFAGSLDGLEFLVCDVEADEFAFSAVDLIFAALLFEYVDARARPGRRGERR